MAKLNKIKVIKQTAFRVLSIPKYSFMFMKITRFFTGKYSWNPIIKTPEGDKPKNWAVLIDGKMKLDKGSLVEDEIVIVSSREIVLGQKSDHIPWKQPYLIMSNKTLQGLRRVNV